MGSRRSNFVGRREHRLGLSLVEVAVSTLLTGVVLVGATDLLGNVISGRTSTSDRAVGEQLALQLMAEIVSNHYEDPNSPEFGPEADEQTGDRSLFDDLDDYHNWSSVQAEDADGVALMHTTGWVREVTVTETIDADVMSEGIGLRRIAVSVEKNGEPVAQVVVYRNNLQ